jgi:hypothetical protein
VKRFGIKGKLAPLYISPFLILARLGNVAYRLELPPTLVGVHNVFHVSRLRKCLKPPVDVVVDDVLPLDAERLTSRCRPILSRAPSEDSGSTGPSHEALNDSILQSSVEPSFRARGYMGDRGISSF